MLDSGCALEMNLDALFVGNCLKLFTCSFDVRYYHEDVLVLLSVVGVLIVVVGLFFPWVVVVVDVVFLLEL